jgi:hypothetical protein
MIRGALALGTLAVASLLAHGQQRSVLFIGNSYTNVNNLPEVFRQLALSLGDTVTTGSSAPGGYTFQSHVINAPTLAAIHSDDWDFVVLQEQSQIPSFPQEQVEAECYPYAAQLVDTILAHDACSQAVFYMTWGRQNGDDTNCDFWPPVCTYAGMQAQLRESYLNMAEDNAAFCAPAGIAWKHVREAYPMLNLYSSDGSHPSVAGSYLVANVMYATMYRASTVGSTYTFGLAADTALFLRQIASATVLDSLEVWNIGVNDPDAAFTFLDLGGSQAVFNPATTDGSHVWLFPNDPYSTDPSPIHQFPGMGDWQVTHIVTDDCGRVDTAVQVVNISFTGIIDLGWDPGPYDVWGTSDEIRITVLESGHHGFVELFDVMGRSMLTARLSSDKLFLPCPKGIYVCRIRDQRGDLWVKKVIIP